MEISFSLYVFILFYLFLNIENAVQSNQFLFKTVIKRHLSDNLLSISKRSLYPINSNEINVNNVKSSYGYYQSVPSSFAILVNFGIDGKRKMLFSNIDPHQCEEKEIWDPFNGQCRQLYCSAHFTLIGFNCVEINNQTNLYQNSISFLDSNSKYVDITLGFNILEPISDTKKWIESQNVSFEDEFKTKFSESFGHLDPKRIEKVIDIPLQNQFLVNFILIEDNTTIWQNKNNNEAILAVLSSTVSHRALDFAFFDKRVEAYVIHTTLSEIQSFCKNHSELSLWYSNSEFYMKTINNISYLFVNQTGRRYSPGQYLSNILYVQNIQMLDNSDVNKVNISSTAMVCETQNLIEENCTQILLNRSEYTWIDSDSGFTRLKTIYGQYHDRFQLAPNGTYVCLHPYINQPQDFTQDFVENILSTVLLIISITALTCVLITYSIFRCLRSTISGFNTINLSLCIELMQIIFLTGQHLINCRVSAIILHFVLLLTISWSSVIAYDMYRTFGVTKIKLREKNVRKLRIIYWFIANICPTIVVIISIICEKYSSALNPDYGDLGDSTGCWIRNSSATFLFFGVPLIINLLINLILYMLTVCQVRVDLKTWNTVRKVTRIPSDSSETSNKSSVTSRSVSTSSTTSLTHKSRPNSVVIFTRLGALMGFTWIIALIIAVIPQKFEILLTILSYLFVILNTSQGVVIFIAFLCNSRVAKLWKNILKLKV